MREEEREKKEKRKRTILFFLRFILYLQLRRQVIGFLYICEQQLNIYG